MEKKPEGEENPCGDNFTRTRDAVLRRHSPVIGESIKLASKFYRVNLMHRWTDKSSESQGLSKRKGAKDAEGEKCSKCENKKESREWLSTLEFSTFIFYPSSENILMGRVTGNRSIVAAAILTLSHNRPSHRISSIRVPLAAQQLLYWFVGNNKRRGAGGGNNVEDKATRKQDH